MDQLQVPKPTRSSTHNQYGPLYLVLQNRSGLTILTANLNILVFIEDDLVFQAETAALDLQNRGLKLPNVGLRVFYENVQRFRRVFFLRNSKKEYWKITRASFEKKSHVYFIQT